METPVVWYYIKQGQSSAFSIRKNGSHKNANPYKNLFRAFYFVDLIQETPDDFIDRIINIKTADELGEIDKMVHKVIKPWDYRFYMKALM